MLRVKIRTNTSNKGDKSLHVSQRSSVLRIRVAGKVRVWFRARIRVEVAASFRTRVRVKVGTRNMCYIRNIPWAIPKIWEIYRTRARNGLGFASSLGSGTWLRLWTRQRLTQTPAGKCTPKYIHQTAATSFWLWKDSTGFDVNEGLCFSGKLKHQN